jgi:hypothetical protein
MVVTVSSPKTRSVRPLRIALLGITFLVAAAGCGSTNSHPVTITFRIGEARTYNASQLPARSTLVCRVNWREDGRTVPYVATIDVPSWSSWDPHLSYGWTQSSVVGDTYFGMKSENHGKLLRVSCAHRPGGL